MIGKPCHALFLIACAVLSACGIARGECTIHSAIVPTNATADHSAKPPGNEARFSLSSTVEGNCPMIPDRKGKWSTSDPENTMIGSQGVATCVNATATPVTILNSGTVRGRPYPSATLVCK
jgi:hypothetical protein